MKLIHCADLHLASKLDSRFSYDKSKKRRKELFETFGAIADYAEKEKISAVLLCGDIFDECAPRFSEVKQFTDIVASHPDVDFLCLAGNHDESLSFIDRLPPNLLTFDENLKRYNYGNVDIYGIEPTKENCDGYYEKLFFEPSQINILMLHGQAVSSGNKGAPDTVLLPRLKNRNIDYLALGHIHSYFSEALDQRGIYCYSGCPEGRGYDECGPKGFVLLTIENGKITHEFIPFACRTVIEKRISVTGAENTAQAYNKVMAEISDIDSKNLVRIHLVGKLPPSITIDASSIEENLKTRYFHASVKNEVGILFDPEDFKDELSLKGEFYRTVWASKELSEAEKEQVLAEGLAALEGEGMNFR